jgi:predicted  nucleic acid-binding Zn-ribbon protein
VYTDIAVMNNDDVKLKWHNFYCCPQCGHQWEDDWDSQCDDDCPECGCRHISPYKSEEIRQTSPDREANMSQYCKTFRIPVEITFTTDPAELDDRQGEPVPTKESLLAYLQDALVLQVDTEGNGQPNGAAFAASGIDWDAATLLE